MVIMGMSTCIDCLFVCACYRIYGDRYLYETSMIMPTDLTVIYISFLVVEFRDECNELW